MSQTEDIAVIGVDLGGTKVLSGKVLNGEISDQSKEYIAASGSEDQVLESIFKSIEGVLDSSLKGIGVGVPSVVDPYEGIVYDVQNIPSWKEVHLKKILEQRYQLPVYLNNDANCFAIGEQYFGKGQGYENFVALIIGTGFAAGLVLNGKLYNGSNCGAGEFGMIPYLDTNYEYYCSGQFFEHTFMTTAQQAHGKAMDGNAKAKDMFSAFGRHIGSAIKSILYAIDPEIIILGGSVSKAFDFFKGAMYDEISDFAYTPVLNKLKIECSEQPDIAVLGAAALCYDQMGRPV